LVFVCLIQIMTSQQHLACHTLMQNSVSNRMAMIQAITVSFMW